MDALVAYCTAITLVTLTAVSGSYFTNTSVQSKWYQCIQPKWTPPKIVFPIVWTLLYILIAISFGRILSNEETFENNTLIAAMLLNLIFNTLWCYFYFTKQDVLAALITIFCLSLTIGAITIHVDDRFIQFAMLVYFIWIAFATLLNTASLFNSRQCLLSSTK